MVIERVIFLNNIQSEIYLYHPRREKLKGKRNEYIRDGAFKTKMANKQTY
jgi:hypothetical protein